MAAQAPKTRTPLAVSSPALWVLLGALAGALLVLSSRPAPPGHPVPLRPPRGAHPHPHPEPGVPLPPHLAGFARLRERLPWEPLLTDEEVQRAQGYYGSGSAMRRVAAKLLAGQPIKVVTLGGSITRGTGATHPSRGYTSLFFSWVNATFPHSGHAFINQGIGGTTSTIFMACVEQLVPPDTDIVTLEFTYNDERDGGYTKPSRQAFEQLLRKLLRLPSSPALVLLHHYAWGASYGPGHGKGLYFFPPEQELTTIATFYDVPVVSLRSAVWRNLAAGIEGFQLDKIVPNKPDSGPTVAAPQERHKYFFADFYLHPSDQGHKALAEALAGPLMRALGEAAAERAAAAAAAAAATAGEAVALEQGPPSSLPPGHGEDGGSASLTTSANGGDEAVGSSSDTSSSSSTAGSNGTGSSGSAGSSSSAGSESGSGSISSGFFGTVRRDPRLEGLPPPMIPGNQEVTTVSCYIQQSFEPAVRNSSGSFAWRPERPAAADFVAQKWAWSGFTPGDWIELELDTRAPAPPGKPPPAGNSLVWLTSLRSYQHMGVASQACVSGCGCKPSRIDATTPHLLSLFMPFVFEVTQHEHCRIRITILPDAGQVPSGEHKFAVNAVVVARKPA